MAKPKFFLEFYRRDDQKSFHVPIGYAWQEGPDDLHVQFDGPAEDNFFVPYNAKKGVYLLRHKGVLLECEHMAFKAAPEPDSVLLDQAELERDWISPNRTYTKKDKFKHGLRVVQKECYQCGKAISNSKLPAGEAESHLKCRKN
jgi:hypothetical protein